MAKLAVLDPSGLSRAGLMSLLQALGFDDLVEGAHIADLTCRIGDGPEPDVVLVNLTRNTRAIDTLMRDVAEACGHTRVVFLAETLDLDMLSRCFTAGASGYLLENISRDALGKSLTLVAAGGKVFPPELVSYIPALAAKPAETGDSVFMAGDSRLSGREVEILHCLAQGQSNKAIGQALDIAEATVKVHVKRILRKIHVANRTQAALWAASRGLTAAGKFGEPRSSEQRTLVSAE